MSQLIISNLVEYKKRLILDFIKSGDGSIIIEINRVNEEIGQLRDV